MPFESTVSLQDRLTGALVGLARAAASNEKRITQDTYRLVREALCATAFPPDGSAFSPLLAAVAAEKARLSPGCSVCDHPCGRTEDYDMSALWNAPAASREGKTLLLLSVRSLSADACRAAALGRTDDAVDAFLLQALDILGNEWDPEDLLAFARKAARLHLLCRELLL